MNKTWIWVIVILLLFGGLIYYVVNDDSVTSNTLEENNTSTSGRVVVSFADAAASMANVSDVTMQVDRVELYNQSRGWVTVASSAKEYQLLALNKNKETKIYGEANMDTDVYTRARVTLGDVVVHTKSNGDKTATLPGRNIDTDIVAIVDGGKTTSLKFDILADKSLYTTAKGQYIFSPAVKVESRSNTYITTDDANGVVTISGGIVDSEKSAGMDIDGSMKNDFMLNVNTKLDVNASGSVINLGATSTTIIDTNSLIPQ